MLSSVFIGKTIPSDARPAGCQPVRRWKRTRPTSQIFEISVEVLAQRGLKVSHDDGGEIAVTVTVVDALDLRFLKPVGDLSTAQLRSLHDVLGGEPKCAQIGALKVLVNSQEINSAWFWHSLWLYFEAYRH